MLSYLLAWVSTAIAAAMHATLATTNEQSVNESFFCEWHRHTGFVH